jgi:hypothetical protein
MNETANINHSMNKQLFIDKDRLDFLLAKLNAKLKERSLKGVIDLYGGTAMLLLTRARKATKDIDATFIPTKEFREIIKEVAEEQEISPDWLNDGVKGYVSANPDIIKYKDLSNLEVNQLSPKYLLSMKILSSRTGTEDISDIKFLINHIEIKKKSELLDIFNTYYGRHGNVSALHRALSIIDEISDEMKLE